MKLPEEEAFNSIITAVQAQRTDVLKAVLDTIIKNWDRSEFLQFLNNKNEHGSFLHLVTRNDQADMVRLLLMYGADPTVVDKKGLTPISIASKPHTKSVYNDALFSSIAQQELTLMKRLFAASTDTDIRDNLEKLNTLLHWAVSFENLDVIHFLVGQEVLLDVENAKGFTPLHEAVLSGKFKIVELLVRLGADVHHPVQGNSEHGGKSAINLAIHRGDPKVIQVFNEISANSNPPVHEPCDYPNKQNELPADLASVNRSENQVECNGHTNGFQRSFNETEPPSHDVTGTESVFGMSEMNTSLPYVRGPVRPVITDSRLHWLWPPPKQMQQLEDPPFSLNQPWNISFIGSSLPLHRIMDIWDVHKPTLLSLGIDPIIGNVSNRGLLPDESTVTCCVKAQLFPNPESYRLTISSDRITIICSDGHGLHYALSSLVQLITLCQDDNLLPALHIEDSPSLRMRAVFIDISPTGRAPLLESLFSMVDFWRSLKLNQVHLYTRTSSSSVRPWPYSNIDLVTFDRYCLDRGVEVVPALDIDGETLELEQLHTLISNTKSCFPSTTFFHAGPNLTTILFDQKELFNALPSDVTWLLCANSIREKRIVPTSHASFILVEYGFQADYNYHEKTQAAWEQSTSLCFSAGTASWDCVSGYPEAAAANILHAAQAAVDRGSLGSIVATWTESVALGSLLFALPGWILQAGLSWNHSIHWDYIQNSLGDLVSLWALNETLEKRPSVGTAIVELGRIETWLFRHARGEIEPQSHFESVSIPPSLPPNEGSIHYRLLLDPDNINVDHLSMDSIVRSIRHVKKWHNMLSEAVLPPYYYPFTSNIIQQAILSADFLLLASRIGRGILVAGSNPNSNMGLTAINLGVANLSPTLKTDAANRLLSLADRFKALWVQHYISPSTGLNNVTAALECATRKLLAKVANA